ncbi:MAG: AAA domain-containing protein [Roseburia sp.]|nr:AAA domain-containing protein [Roseburia sp.]MCM1099153.1 AAA domain-containing protein [Ruminococcus flavefaciens]
MNTVFRDLFRAVHEGKWLSIEYHNKEEQDTRYWIGIRDIDVRNRTLSVEGLHLGQYTIGSFERIKIDSIRASRMIEGSFYPVNQNLVRDIAFNPHKYRTLFDNTANLKILNYLEMCNRMDAVPYKSDFSLVQFLDHDTIRGEFYQLNQEQFQTIVKKFQYQAEREQQKGGKLRIRQLAMNVLSIHTAKGLYVLAYRKLNLDVKQRGLRPDDEIIICTEFTLNGIKQSVRQFLDADEYELLNDFEANQEKIKDCIMNRMSRRGGGNVDDMPYIIGLETDIAIDLHKEYQSIMKMYQEEKVPVPISAFFGDLLARPRRTASYPIALIDQKINMDQLLAIHNAMKYPIAYIQGPPGTGKTNTIINTIVTAFFNERTVLFASYNNHPINGVYEKLSAMKYKGDTIPFPILRLGNQDKTREALATMKELYRKVQNIQVYESTLDRNKDDRKERAKRLSELLRRYEELLDLREREETIDRLLDYEKKRGASLQMLSFEEDLQNRQRKQIGKEILSKGEISEAEALALLDDRTEELKKYLYYTSAGYIKKIGLPRNADLLRILEMKDPEEQMQAFTSYLGKKENIAKLQKIFPIIVTTCISAHRLGEPEPMFDMVILDEASQCNIAVSLVPIVRGDNLMLVGDPQQLNPVILLDEATNEKLKTRYTVADEYDYRENSIYKTYLACDAVSDETLLHNHYRCNRRIIEFNNRKYYHSRLSIKSESREEQPLVYVDMPEAKATLKNTAPGEAYEIARYAAFNRDKNIGVITPFVNQKNLIEEELARARVGNVTCGTVHAFQGDEKDVILFSTAITSQTQAGTYEWLKNNKELINVATSRAKDKLIVLSSSKDLERLHQKEGDDDLYELVQYVRSNGTAVVTPKQTASRALGVKPFSSATEEAFLENLTHALENIWLTQSRYVIHKEVAIAHVFQDNPGYNDLFYNGRFDFVVYEKQGEAELPVLAIELDGKEHFEDEAVKSRDRKKNQICKEHDLQLIRVENSYARRYNHIKEILLKYFSIAH